MSRNAVLRLAHHAQHLDLRSGRWALLLVAGVFSALSAKGEPTDFGRDCVRVAVDGLMLDTSAACVAALRHNPAARQQFIQRIHTSLAQADWGDQDATRHASPARSLRRLFEKASQESGGARGLGGRYYGAQ